MGKAVVWCAGTRTRVAKRKDRRERQRLLALLERIETLQRDPSPETRAAITLEDAETVFSPPKEKPPEAPEPPQEEEPTSPDDEAEVDDGEGELNGREWLVRLPMPCWTIGKMNWRPAADAMEDALADAILRNGKEAEGQVEFRGETRDFSIKFATNGLTNRSFVRTAVNT